MRWLLVLITCVSLCTVAVAEPTTRPTTAPASQVPPFEPAEALTVADVVGKWTGKWDDTWAVEFTIAVDPETDKPMATYRWKEDVNGGFNERRMGCTIEGNRLMIGRKFIELSVSAEDPNLGFAYGHFRKPRTTMLNRAPVEKQ